ncbi:Peptidase M60, enhancin and enhancin-like [Shewanella morhuae]|uniref:ImpA family metalloprotease n=1 Tax=Shewanella morhuae TaxID=365591 RepID=UPI0009539FBE|nr:ImpA family metalloprotease [Shewanella morhuae]SIR03887.1 Peptidase M60, enhancin and enhancin-like [Shewanella morhuae]
MRIRLFYATITLLLSGCGGSEDAGSTQPPIQPPVTQYTASSVAATGGVLSPNSQKVASGTSAIFSVIANSGFTLDGVTGCGGNLNGLAYTTAAMVSDCTITPIFISNAEKAIKYQDYTLASATELIDFSIAKLANIDINRKAQIKQLYQGVGNSITWHPSHDSITFSSFMPENTFTVLPSNIDANGASAVRGLVMAGEQQGQRYAAMAENIFSVNTSAQTDALLKNLLGWLTKGADKTSGLSTDVFSIVTAQMPSATDSWYFPHNEGIRTWLTKNYPDAHSINAANTCDYSQLSNCIETLKPDLIVISDIDRQSLGFAGIKAAIAKAKAAGIPLLLSNYWRDESPMLSPLYVDMGLSTAGNYWSKLNANNLRVTDILAEDTNLTKVNALLGKLRESRFDTSVLNDCGSNYLSCNAPAFVDSFKAGADWYRANAVTLDNHAIDVFTKAEFPLMKAGLLLADKYRSEIDYPIAYNEYAQWQQALFADWTISYARAHNLAQPDLGEYVTDSANLSKGNNAHYAYPATISEQKTISVPYADQWTTTGWYALPGQTIKLTRLDSSTANVEIKLNYHRRNTNRAYEQKIYRGPLELAQQRLRLVQGQSLEFSSPYGGPIYLYISGNASSGNDGTLSVDVNAEHVAQHPTVMDFSNPTEIAAFNDRIQNTELPHVDLRTDGAEQHLRRDRFMNAIGGKIIDVNALLNSIVDDHINSVYTLAGLKIQGKSLSESLPSDVLSACKGLFGDDCIDNNLHTRTIIQHANYDQNAQCGAGCSGNPWDAAWNIDPTGWGDNHELGHNLQTNRLNVQYAAASDSDNWAGYGSRAGENSNNIFPYVVKWKTHYLRDGNTGTVTDGHMNHKDLFYVFMSDAAGTTDTSGKRVVFGANCKVLNSGEDRYTAPWASNAYAVHNGYRMAFYIQMALKAHGMTLNDGTTLENGFNLFTLLYQHSRIFSKYANNANDWEANRSKLGFSQFPFDGHGVYSGKAVRDIPGNDFMLVSLSQLTGKDWRSHFDLLGLRYSSLAAAQTIANATSGTMPMGMYELETDLPPANMSQGLTFIPLSLSEGTTQWKGAGSPLQCVKP